jgi:hypothetical protein
MILQVELTCNFGVSVAHRACFVPVTVRNVTLTCCSSSVKALLFVVPRNSGSRSGFPSITDQTSTREQFQ